MWTDQLEAWSTFSAAVGTILAAIFTLWLLVHQIREARAARADANTERTLAQADRDHAAALREIAEAEQQDRAGSQARAVLLLGVEEGPFSRFVTSDRHLEFQVVIHNFSAEPVRFVQIVFERDGRLLQFDSLKILGPRTVIKLRIAVNSGYAWVRTAHPQAHFLDSHGQWWTRRLEGMPERSVQPSDVVQIEGSRLDPVKISTLA